MLSSFCFPLDQFHMTKSQRAILFMALHISQISESSFCVQVSLDFVSHRKNLLQCFWLLGGSGLELHSSRKLMFRVPPFHAIAALRKRFRKCKNSFILTPGGDAVHQKKSSRPVEMKR